MQCIKSNVHEAARACVHAVQGLWQCHKMTGHDLPFYYHTSSHTHFYEGPLPDFSEAPKPQKKKRVPRREQPTAFAPRHATIPVQGSLAVRAKFHNVPIELPPPSTGPVHLLERSYA